MIDTRAFDDLNPDWEPPIAATVPGWEPWEDYDEADSREGGCDYCGTPEVREYPDPFGGKPCCDRCFNLIIGGDEDDPPWRCGNDPAFLASTDPEVER